jgi:hypothetical protein
MNSRKPTGPLPDFETDAPMTNAQKNLTMAFQMLDIQNDYGRSRDGMIEELVFNFDLSPDQAADVYRAWLKVQP